MSGGPAPEPSPAPSVARARVAVLLAWAVPGLGHIVLGRRARGAFFAVLLFFMFGMGLWLEGTLSRPGSGAYLATLATIADLGNGLWYVGAQLAGWGGGRAASATHEAGNAFHWSAGVMNMLVMLDAWDIASGRKDRAMAS